MKFFYDTEFIEDGKTIDLISIGIVAEDGREYYAVNADMPVDRIHKHEWLMRNVWPHLPVVGHEPEKVSFNVFPQKREAWGRLDPDSTLVRPHRLIANEVREFLLGPDPTEPKDVELWAWYSAYDHVVLAQLWGPMVRMPKGLPWWTGDLKQEHVRQGRPEIPDQAEGEHNALADARCNVAIARALGILEGDDHA